MSNLQPGAYGNVLRLFWCVYIVKQGSDTVNIQEMATNELKPYANNPRDNKASVAKVANSIKEFGFKVPIVIDSKNVIVVGHTRWLAAQSLGLDKVPCIIADDLTQEQIRAFRLVDNKVGEESEWLMPSLQLELLELKDFFDMSSFGFEVEVEDEESDKSKSQTVYEQMELKAFEHWDYLVFVFDNQMDWLNIADYFKIEKVNAGYGDIKKVGVGRVVNGKRLLEAIQHQNIDIKQGQK